MSEKKPQGTEFFPDAGRIRLIQVPEICILVASVSCPPKKGFFYARDPFKTVFPYVWIFSLITMSLYVNLWS